MANAAEMDHENFWMPLYLSTIAGASTCLGAAVVFCHPKKEGNKRIVSNATMSFSLALAGSVMITVSMVSIGPECLKDPVTGVGVMPVMSISFLHRLLAFGLGCVLYFGLSWFAFPEPDQILGFDDTVDNDEESVDSLETLQTTATFRTEKASNTKKNRSTRHINVRSRHGQAGACGSSPKSRSDRSIDTSFETEELIAKGSFLTSPESVYSADSNSKREVDSRIFFNLLSRRWFSGSDLDTQEQRRAWRVAMLLFISLLVHNFPEGLAVAASALESEKLGITVTIGIMIHNIPEGIAISVPCLMARPDAPWLCFFLASFSGLAEPCGAFVALFFLRKVAAEEDRYTNPALCMENVLAFVAGIMITVALWELFPEGKRYSMDDNSHFIAGTLLGIVVMLSTELYMA